MAYQNEDVLTDQHEGVLVNQNDGIVADQGDGVPADTTENDLTANLTGRQKAAALLITLGADACAEIFKALKDSEVEQLAATIAKMETIEPETISAIIRDFHNVAANDVSAQGGMDFAGEVLSKALGDDSERAIERISSRAASFDLLTSSPSSTELLLDVIREEHPQTISLILVHIQEQRAAEILSLLSPALQTEVVTRIANMTAVSPEVISQIELALQAKSRGHERVNAGGTRDAAEILNRVDSNVEKRILDSISVEDPKLAEEISDLMFTYDDIVLIADVGVQKLLQEIDGNDLVMSLRASTDVLKAKVMKNISERRREAILEDLEDLPPVRLKDALAAQRRIVTVAKRMSQSGEIEIVREKEDEVLI